MKPRPLNPTKTFHYPKGTPMSEIPGAIWRSMAEDARKAIGSFDDLTSKEVEKYDHAFLTGDDDDRDKAAQTLVMFLLVAYLGLGGTMDKLRVAMDTVKAMQDA